MTKYTKSLYEEDKKSYDMSGKKLHNKWDERGEYHMLDS